MAGVSEYRNEQFIQQYEHITKLKLLTDEELLAVKRKRSFFEISIKNSPEIAHYLSYIKYEIALMKKLQQRDIEVQRHNAKALDKVIAFHVKDLFRMTLKKFQAKRKIWEHYIAFAKQKFPSNVTVIYQEMLHFHHKPEDYIEAARYEMSKKNYTVASSLLIQAMGNQKDSCDELVEVYIECSLSQGQEGDEDAKKASLLQASKFYDKFLKDSNNVSIHCDLLKKIQAFEYAMEFQNYILTTVMDKFTDCSEVWEILVIRHLSGLIYKSAVENDEEKVKEDAVKIPFEARLQHAIEIYDQSLNTVSDSEMNQMFSFYINKMLELDALKNMASTSLKAIRKALGRTLQKGYEEGRLSESHFLCFLQLKMFNVEKYQSDIESMIAQGLSLYPQSMVLQEIVIKFLLAIKKYESVNQVFNDAIEHNGKEAIRLYKFLCGIYLKDPIVNHKAKTAMLEAINSSNKQLSEAFQPYYIEYLALTESIDKARDAFGSLLKSRTINSLSLEFFNVMITLEESQEIPNEKTIKNHYELATEHFGQMSPQVWLDFIKFQWTQGKYSDADKLRSRALGQLNDVEKVNEFEMKYTLLRNDSGTIVY